MKHIASTSLLSTAIAALLVAGPAHAVDLEFMLSSNDATVPVWLEMIERYKEVAPDVTINVNQVGYNIVRDQLELQLQAGTGPDMATVTNLGGLNQYYLDMTPYVDAAVWNENYAGTIEWFRAGKPDGIHGWMAEVTVSGPYVNRTLFEEAGVEVPPKGATWEEWADATAQVQEELDLYAGMVMDRSGHRFAGPAMSYGAKFYDAEDNLIVDDGYKAFAQLLLDWHASGLMPPDIWPAVSGQTNVNGNDLFLREDVPFYFSGSWNINTLDQAIGDQFDWSVEPAPCGPSGCGVMPGGTAIVAFGATEHPEEVAAFIDWLASTDIAREFYSKAGQIPAHVGLQAEGLDYAAAGADEKVQAALTAFTQSLNEARETTPQAFKLQGDPLSSPFHGATANYLSAAINGELTLDEALDKIRADIAPK